MRAHHTHANDGAGVHTYREGHVVVGFGVEVQPSEGLGMKLSGGNTSGWHEGNADPSRSTIAREGYARTHELESRWRRGSFGGWWHGRVAPSDMRDVHAVQVATTPE